MLNPIMTPANAAGTIKIKNQSAHLFKSPFLFVFKAI